MYNSTGHHNYVPGVYPPSFCPDAGSVLRSTRYVALPVQRPSTPLLRHRDISIVQRHKGFYERLTRESRPHQQLATLCFATIKQEVADILSAQGITYKSRLRIAESLHIGERSQNLHEFIKQHDTMMYQLLQLQKRADMALIAPQIDVLTKAKVQLHYLRWALPVTQIRSSGDPNTITKDRVLTELQNRGNDVVGWMKSEMLEGLVALDNVLPHPNEDVVYKNVSPDHDILVLGHTITGSELSSLHAQVQHKLEASLEVKVGASNDTDRDHRIRCAICLESYTDDNPPFQLAQC